MNHNKVSMGRDGVEASPLSGHDLSSLQQCSIEREGGGPNILFHALDVENRNTQVLCSLHGLLAVLVPGSLLARLLALFAAL